MYNTTFNMVCIQNKQAMIMAIASLFQIIQNHINPTLTKKLSIEKFKLHCL